MYEEKRRRDDREAQRMMRLMLIKSERCIKHASLHKYLLNQKVKRKARETRQTNKNISSMIFYPCFCGCSKCPSNGKMMKTMPNHRPFLILLRVAIGFFLSLLRHSFVGSLSRTRDYHEFSHR